MGMTDKQFQGFVRLTLDKLKCALRETPDNKNLKELCAIFRDMIEEDDQKG